MKTLRNPYKVRLFTYGTLKKEGRLAQLVASGKFLGEYTTLHSVFDLVDYIGELYEIDLKTMDMINRMESNADYTPIIVEVVNEGNTLTNAIMFVNVTDEEHMKAVGLTQTNIVNEKGHKEWIN